MLLKQSTQQYNSKTFRVKSDEGDADTQNICDEDTEGNLGSL